MHYLVVPLILMLILVPTVVVVEGSIAVLEPSLEAKQFLILVPTVVVVEGSIAVLEPSLEAEQSLILVPTVVVVEGSIAVLEPSLEAKQFLIVSNVFPNLRQLKKSLQRTSHR